ncbi:hypothetical protein JCM9279_006554 [Rhodotorula babjevae]
MTTAPLDRLSKLPSDLLVDSLLPQVAPRDLIALSRVNHEWHRFVTGEGGPCEILWQRRAASDFRFPVLASGRRTGWRALYSSLASSSASVWGQTTNGRLGFPSHRTAIPPSLRSLVIGDALPVPTRIELPAPPVALVAGGWSFHALGSNGEVVSWGQLNGGLFAGDDAPLANEGRTARPMVLPQSEALGSVAQLEAGRAHVVMRGEDGRVWEMRAFGRVVEVRDEAGRWGTSAGGGQAAVVLVQAGWDYSAVLTAGGDIYVWWGLAPAASDEGAAAAGEADLDDPSTQGVAFPLDLDTLRLPPLPSSSSTADPVSLISCGDDFILALTRAGALYRLDLSPVAPGPNQQRVPPGAVNDPHDSPIRSRESRSRLEAAFVSGARSWTYLHRFCDMGEVGRLEGLSASSGTRITHISAHFESFAAYSVPSSSDPAGSIVLLGRKDMDDSAAPIVIPELQNIGVIKIAHGDYHSLALTSSGHLLAWGAWSAGALGLGHPQLANTPLSSPSAAPPPRDSQQQPRPYPTPQFDDAPQPHPLFPGFLPARPAAPVQRPPERVETPTRVRFHGELRGGMETGRSKYVYAVTASGWHSGCLAVEASSSSSSSTSTSTSPTPTRLDDQDDDEQEQDDPMIRLHRRATAEQELADLARTADEETLNGSSGWMGRLGTMGPFRVGFAGRGARAGGGGGLTRGGGRV